jgi:hypothetical protein
MKRSTAPSSHEVYLLRMRAWKEWAERQDAKAMLRRNPNYMI